MYFPDFAGNQKIRESLGAAFQAGRPSHAYILSGPAGSGKKTLARLIACAFCCPEDGAPCMRCSHCKKIMKGVHPDVITLDNDGGMILVDQVREGLRADAWIRPNEARKKVYVVAHAQDMNAAAQNALLLLLEEPPAYAVFLLLCENVDAILPTVRSRCAELSLQPVLREEALPFLRTRYPEASEEELSRALASSGGYLGPAGKLLESGDGDDAEKYAVRFMQTLADGGELALLSFMMTLEKLKREEFAAFLDAVSSALRDCIVYASSGVPSVGPRKEEVFRLCSKKSPRELMRLSGLISRARACGAYNVGQAHIAGMIAAGCFLHE